MQSALHCIFPGTERNWHSYYVTYYGCSLCTLYGLAFTCLQLIT